MFSAVIRHHFKCEYEGEEEEYEEEFLQRQFDNGAVLVTETISIGQFTNGRFINCDVASLIVFAVFLIVVAHLKACQ